MRNLLLILTLMYVKANAQTGEEQVKQAVSNLFTGMRNADTNLLRSVFAPGASLQTVSKNKEGQTVVRSENIDEFISFTAKPHQEVYDERISFDVVRIDGDLATVWTPYQFYVGTKFSHCGVNSFQLVRLKGVWQIQYIIDTRRKDNCN
ncbi:nuclear transport factor 2 family protein [Chitinophagaceae bacterium LB-8]|uniref:Nuclear transport factor 2 family protein n=1 Tax=Paraflavisolibacter caeni TaxID=2982496 RepID=A0A9X2XPJ0_9BACT|nr:nuclear transport factor 2 family protein [Paraflavisolibacter caeni]MCU7551458.1 nuclear transport factor 2 family protein [Paraflavisolibacter caeni]